MYLLILEDNVKEKWTVDAQPMKETRLGIICMIFYLKRQLW